MVVMQRMVWYTISYEWRRVERECNAMTVLFYFFFKFNFVSLMNVHVHWISCITFTDKLCITKWEEVRAMHFLFVNLTRYYRPPAACVVPVSRIFHWINCGRCYGNTIGIDAFDLNFGSREYNWVNNTIVLFVDSPVVACFSYVEKKEFLYNSDDLMTRDLVELKRILFESNAKE